MALISTVPKKPAAANQFTNQTPPVQKQLIASALQTNSHQSFFGPKAASFPVKKLAGRSTLNRTTKQPTHLTFKPKRPSRAGEGNRTLTTSLEGWGSAIELHPQMSNRNLCRIQLKTNQSNFLTRRPEESSRSPSESKPYQRNRPEIQTRARPQTLLQQATLANRFNPSKPSKHTHNNAQFGSLTKKIEPLCQSS